MAISRDEVLHVARLARLALTDEEIGRLTSELDKILEAVGIVVRARPRATCRRPPTRSTS